MTTITLPRATVEQALEALELVTDLTNHDDEIYEAITALRAALAQQAEPLNLRDPAVQKRLATQWGYVPAAQQAEPVEPVAWAFRHSDGTYHDPSVTEHSAGMAPLYTAPPQRKPLTEKEMYIVEEEARKNFRLAQAGPRGQMITYWDSLTPWLIRAVERAHGIKE